MKLNSSSGRIIGYGSEYYLQYLRRVMSEREVRVGNADQMMVPADQGEGLTFLLSVMGIPGGFKQRRDVICCVF